LESLNPSSSSFWAVASSVAIRVVSGRSQKLPTYTNTGVQEEDVLEEIDEDVVLLIDEADSDVVDDIITEEEDDDSSVEVDTALLVVSLDEEVEMSDEVVLLGTSPGIVVELLVVSAIEDIVTDTGAQV
jgi:hypothetical protein